MLKHTQTHDRSEHAISGVADHAGSPSTSNLSPESVRAKPEKTVSARPAGPMKTFGDTPLLIGNPVFHREVAMRLSGRRMRRAGRVGMALTLGVVLPLTYLIFIGNALGPGSPLNVRSAAMVLEAVLLPVIAASLASGVFTSERERQTWNALLLSRLTAPQIVIGKLAGALVPALLILAALLPINLGIGVMADLPWRVQFVELACLLSTLTLSASIGTFWSWAVRRTQSAQVFTTCTMLTLLLGSFILHSLWRELNPNGDPYFGTIANFVPHWFNPVVVLTELASNRVALAGSGLAIATFLAFATVATTVFIAIPIRRLGKGPSEMEH